MDEMGIGNQIYSLRKKIQQIQSDLNALGGPMIDMPELISSANLLRSNEYLSKSNEKKSQLIEVYEQYSKYLEEMLLTVFDIQNDLKNILREQSSLISETKHSKKSKTLKSKTKRSTKK